MMHESQTEAGGSAERILAAAAALFASYGYHACRCVRWPQP